MADTQLKGATIQFGNTSLPLQSPMIPGTPDESEEVKFECDKDAFKPMIGTLKVVSESFRKLGEAARLASYSFNLLVILPPTERQWKRYRRKIRRNKRRAGGKRRSHKRRNYIRPLGEIAINGEHTITEVGGNKVTFKEV
jgi:hypothetical protein